VPLFVNVEPSTVLTPCPPDLLDVIETASERFQVVLEITERSLGDDPASLLGSVATVRGRAARIALDDVGVNPASLALMPLLAPDVIKLDRSLVQSRPSPKVSYVVNAVLAESERTGAVILAEGIETERHLAVAISMGATLGQGWLFGRPGPLPSRFTVPDVDLPRTPATVLAERTPFELARHRRATTRTTKEMLIPLSNHLENRTQFPVEPSVLLTSFQRLDYFDDTTRARYARMAGNGALTAVFAEGMPPVPVPGVRGSPLSAGDPMIGEWVVIILGGYFAGGLFARELSAGLPGPPAARQPVASDLVERAGIEPEYDPPRGSKAEELQRVFDFVVSYDRSLIIDAAHVLLRRLRPLT
jgi:hypothetical protein